jgi:hypothetical protein
LKFFKIWVDGSFVETKENPNDIDALFFMTNDSFKIMSDVKKRDLYRYFYKSKLDWLPLIDHYFITTFPTDHELFDSYIKKKDYWVSLFGQTRNLQPKGIVELQYNIL